MPNFTHTKVDPNRLSTMARNIDNSIQTIESAFRRIDSTLRTTIYNSWEGVAKDQFFSQYSADVIRFTSQLRALRAYNDQLKEAAGIFDSADVKAGELVNQLRIG